MTESSQYGAMAPTACEPNWFQLSDENAENTTDQVFAMNNIGANCAVGTSLTNGETLPKRFTPHSSKAVAFDARSHVDAVYAKRTPPIFPRLRLPREANFGVLSPPPLTLRPTVRTAFRRAFETIIATTKEE
ncbi:hypothetical protein [Sinorhizobium fredii]|uniref:hypothetical protein n=1 Tax=Rhizobium fredii TaxID=380 RepID=UPI0012FD1480|nr:hypothetical protein [Sinorhizobium fredii]